MPPQLVCVTVGEAIETPDKWYTARLFSGDWTTGQFWRNSGGEWYLSVYAQLIHVDNIEELYRLEV